MLCRYSPFGGGPRKFVGDQFAFMEAIIAVAVVLKQFGVELTPGQKIEMTTGATILTTNGLYMKVPARKQPRQQVAHEEVASV